MIGKLLIDWLAARQEQLSHRQLLLVSGNEQWCRQHVQQILVRNQKSTLILSDAQVAGTEQNIKTSPISQYKQQLGREFELVIYNAFNGVQPNALYAIEGCIGRSGLLIIMSPDMKHWPSYEAKQPGISFTYNNYHATSHYVTRLIQHIHNDSTIGIFSESLQRFPFAFVQQCLIGDESEPSNNTNVNAGLLVEKTLSTEQQLALDQLLKSLQREHSIGLITAKRGRGKSTLLAHFAAAFVNQEPSNNICITAPHINNAAKARLEFSALSKHSGVRLDYVAPDQLLSLPHNTVLLIDEAAAIAPSIVLAACRHFSHVVMATTVSGYEGSGLGFEIRVLPKLISIEPNITKTTLIQPMRWFIHDPLESAFTSIFSPFKTQIGDVHDNLMQTPNIHCLKTIVINKPELLKNETLLQQIFGLLTQSHYQTTPNDLMRVIDANDHQIFGLVDKHDITDPSKLIYAVAVVINEGSLVRSAGSSLIDDIKSGKRRINGHLVSQNLTTALVNDWFITSSNWRISRIAVTPHYRRQGIGQRLLNGIRGIAQSEGADYLSTSFGLTPELLSFWQHQQYQLIRIGARRDTSSGEHSGIMILPVSIQAKSTFIACGAVLLNDMQYLSDYVINLDKSNKIHSVIKQTSQHMLNSSCATTTEQIMLNRLAHFIHGDRSLTNTISTVYYFSKRDVTQLLKQQLQHAHLKGNSKRQKQENLNVLKRALSEYLQSSL